MATLLSIIQDFCKLNALAVPTTVIGSSNSQTVQLYQTLVDLLGELVTEAKFNVTTRELVFSTTPVSNQGSWSDLGCTGFQYAIFETFYDRTLGRPLLGPVTETEWQELQALPSEGAEYRFRIKNDSIYLYPIPDATTAHDIAFEYISSYGVYSAGDTDTLIETPTADTDTFVFPESLLKRGLAFRWKQIKGLPYQADEMKYWALLNNFVARDKVKRRINVGAPDTVARPGIFVPTNSWMQ